MEICAKCREIYWFVWLLLLFISKDAISVFWIKVRKWKGWMASCQIIILFFRLASCSLWGYSCSNIIEATFLCIKKNVLTKAESRKKKRNEIKGKYCWRCGIISSIFSFRFDQSNTGHDNWNMNFVAKYIKFFLWTFI